MKKLFSLFAATVLLFVSVATASADSRCGGRPGITFYDEENFGGAQKTYCGGYLPLWSFVDADMSPEGWSNRAGSLQTYNFPSDGSGIRLYDLKNYGANKLTVTQNSDIAKLSDWYPGTYVDGFNNKISSFKTFYGT